MYLLMFKESNILYFPMYKIYLHHELILLVWNVGSWRIRVQPFYIGIMIQRATKRSKFKVEGKNYNACILSTSWNILLANIGNILLNHIGFNKI